MASIADLNPAFQKMSVFATVNVLISKTVGVYKVYSYLKNCRCLLNVLISKTVGVM